MSGAALLREHVARFNDGVRSGDFGAMVNGLALDAVLAFEGVPVGPFAGRQAIAAAYRERPPDDEIRILDERDDGREVVAGYAWERAPGTRAGELRLRHDGRRITHLTVTFA